MKSLFSFLVLVCISCNAYAYNTVYESSIGEYYNTGNCYPTYSQCMAAKKCGWDCDWNYWNAGFCWPGVPLAAVKEFWEVSQNVRPGSSGYNPYACDELSYNLEWVEVPSPYVRDCGSTTLLSMKVGYDEDIYTAYHESVGPGDWIFKVWNWRDEVFLGLDEVSRTLESYDLTFWDWVSTGQSLPGLFDAQTFIDNSPKGASYKVDFYISGTTCHIEDYFQAYDWWMDRDCVNNGAYLYLYDFGWWGGDYLDFFDIQRYQDLKGTLPLVPYKAAVQGSTGPLELQYKYNIDYTTWEGINYKFDFVSLCVFASSEGLGAINKGLGSNTKGVGVVSRGVGGFEKRTR